MSKEEDDVKQSSYNEEDLIVLRILFIKVNINHSFNVHFLNDVLFFLTI